MKRWLSALLSICLLLGLASCAVPQGSGPGTAASTITMTVEQETPAPETPEPERGPGETLPEPTPAAQPPAAREDEPQQPGAPPQEELLPEDGSYTTKEDVALYLHQYGRLPGNFITKKQAQELGWTGGSLEPYAPGMCIGGSRFGNYEGLLPQKEGRTYTECDIDTLGAKSRGAKRIVFSNDGLIYYTEDHYESFTLLYGEETE